MARTSIEDIQGWLAQAKKQGATHMIVACDTFSYEDYPVYVMPGQSVQAEYDKHHGPNMQKVMEVYSMALDIQAQLAEPRSFHFEMAPQAPAASTVPARAGRPYAYSLDFSIRAGERKRVAWVAAHDMDLSAYYGVVHGLPPGSDPEWGVIVRDMEIEGRPSFWPDGHAHAHGVALVLMGNAPDGGLPIPSAATKDLGVLAGEEIAFLVEGGRLGSEFVRLAIRGTAYVDEKSGANAAHEEVMHTGPKTYCSAIGPKGHPEAAVMKHADVWDLVNLRGKAITSLPPTVDEYGGLLATGPDSPDTGNGVAANRCRICGKGYMMHRNAALPPMRYVSEGGKPINTAGVLKISRTLSYDEVRAQGDYDDMADLSVIFGHDIVEMEGGTWRWRPNRLVCWLFDHAPVYQPSNLSADADGIPKYSAKSREGRASLNPNDLLRDLYRGMFSMEEDMKLYMQSGYSLAGFAEVFGQRTAVEFKLPGALGSLKSDKDAEAESIIDYMRRVHAGKVLKL